MNTKLASAILGLLALAASCSTRAPSNQSRIKLPDTRRGTVTDDYHGTKIHDPYRWLEDQDGEDTASWVEAQNQVTQAFLSVNSKQNVLRERLTELWNYPKAGTPNRHGKWWVQFKNDGLQNQSVLYRGTSVDNIEDILLDPNKLSEDGTVALGGLKFSANGTQLAFSISRSGSDWREWRVLDVASGKELKDVVRWSKFSSVAWSKDGEGFFYQRYPEPKEGETYEAINLTPRLCYHEIGTKQTRDRVIFENPDQPKWGYHPTVTEDGSFLMIHVFEGTDSRNRVAYRSLPDGQVRMLLGDFDASYSFLGNDGGKFYFETNKDAPRGRVVAIDNEAPNKWQELIPESNETLHSISLIADRFVAIYLEDAHHIVRIHGIDGKFEKQLRLPALGAVNIGGRRGDRVMHFSFNSFTHPPQILRYDFDSGELTTFWAPDVAFDPSDYQTRQVFYQSRDGSRIPMFIVHRKGLHLDGSHPTYLYGYGGFNISLTPRFQIARIAWLELGGVYAQAILRGGGEYGEEWHRAGMLKNKQNVFDDFKAAAHYLIRNDYTRPDKLAIGGGSNGGLLVGACLTQWPELFGAAVPEVGVMDMLRYHKFTIGWAWASEYGSSDDPEMFKVLHGYSPLHNIREGLAYPPTMVMTGDHDDRVLPGHSYKFAATLQRAQGSQAPILLRIDTKSGHGRGKPTSKQIAAAADRWAFLDKVLSR
ncbi:MAG: prolyl oligopeptidase family serine peptidase [Planctomycetota bacterium]|nr:prolyl oligopeptidase family serine peptidase [Planctomycetota bacterium]